MSSPTPNAAEPRTRHPELVANSIASRPPARSSRRCRCRTRDRESRRCAPRFSTSRTSRSRNSRFAPTPPATTSVRKPVTSSAASAFATSTSTTAAGTRARCRPALARRAMPSPPRLRTSVSTAVFSPEKLMSRSPESSIGRGSDTAPRATLLGELRERGSARIRQTEKLRGLVERLAGRVVQRVAEQPVVARRRSLRTAGCGRPTRAARRTETPGRGSASSGESRWPSR